MNKKVLVVTLSILVIMGLIGIIVLGGSNLLSEGDGPVPSFPIDIIPIA